MTETHEEFLDRHAEAKRDRRKQLKSDEREARKKEVIYINFLFS